MKVKGYATSVLSRQVASLTGKCQFHYSDLCSPDCRLQTVLEGLLEIVWLMTNSSNHNPKLIRTNRKILWHVIKNGQEINPALSYSSLFILLIHMCSQSYSSR